MASAVTVIVATVVVAAVVAAVVVVVVGCKVGSVSTNIAVSWGRGVRFRQVLTFCRREAEFVFRCITFSPLLPS